MRDADLNELMHRLELDARRASTETIAEVRTSHEPLALIAAALFDPSPEEHLTRAARLATRTQDRQLVEIVTAHLAGDHERADALIRDHRLDSPDNAVLRRMIEPGSASHLPRSTS